MKQAPFFFRPIEENAWNEMMRWGAGVGDNSLLWTHWTREQICVQGLGISASGDYQTMWSTINKSGGEKKPKDQ